jgi:methyl-accepting chemotaxis protein
LTSRPDTAFVPRFSPDPARPDDLVSSIVALTERTTKLALDSAMEAAQADALGKLGVVIEHVCRLAVGCGVAAGEIGWLVTELGTAGADAGQLAQAERAIAGLQSAVISVACAVQEFSALGGPVELSSSADALRRSAMQLDDRLLELHPAA